ncbi:hypothetical protein FRC11_000267, partial [Ceratobasidium sp. 423]
PSVSDCKIPDAQPARAPCEKEEQAEHSPRTTPEPRGAEHHLHHTNCTSHARDHNHYPTRRSDCPNDRGGDQGAGKPSTHIIDIREDAGSPKRTSRATSTRIYPTRTTQFTNTAHPEHTNPRRTSRPSPEPEHLHRRIPESATRGDRRLRRGLPNGGTGSTL